jgi:hypothetical protein
MTLECYDEYSDYINKGVLLTGFDNVCCELKVKNSNLIQRIWIMARNITKDL